MDADHIYRVQMTRLRFGRQSHLTLTRATRQDPPAVTVARWVTGQLGRWHIDVRLPPWRNPDKVSP